MSVPRHSTFLIGDSNEYSFQDGTDAAPEAKGQEAIGESGHAGEETER